MIQLYNGANHRRLYQQKTIRPFFADSIFFDIGRYFVEGSILNYDP